MGARTFVLALTAIGVGCSPAPKASEVCGAGAHAGETTASFSWTKGRDCPLARFEASGVVAGGELWVMGGVTSARLDVTRRIDIYAPATDAWRPGPDLPGAETHMAVVAIGDDVIVAGGFPGQLSTCGRRFL